MANVIDLFPYSTGDIVSVSSGNWVKQSASGWSYQVSAGTFSLSDPAGYWGDAAQLLANTVLGSSITNPLEVYAEVLITTPATLANDSPVGPAIFKAAANDFYSLKYTGTGNWGLVYWQGGSEWTTIASATGIYTPAAGVTKFRLGRTATNVRAKVWAFADSEPGSWQMDGAYTTIAGARPGMFGRDSSASPYVFSYWSAGDNEAAPVPSGGAPTAPGTPTFTLVTTTSATVTYTAGGAGTTQYQYRVNGGSWINNGTALTFDLSSLTPNTLYTVDVQAGNATPDWSASATDSFTTDSVGGTLKAGALNLLINGQRLYI